MRQVLYYLPDVTDEIGRCITEIAQLQSASTTQHFGFIATLYRGCT